MAIAIVLLFHLGIGFQKGGFVGVDVFYVISGFLICSLIVADLRLREFTFANFYRRRIRRLFPALLAMFLASSVAACVILFPGDFVEFGKSLAAATLFSANFFFVGGQGYFAPDADLTPLQHTWSLAVEEQFYLLFPLVIVLVAQRWPRGLAATAWGAFFASLALSAFLVEFDRSWAFYLLPSRIWELALGALLAFGAIPSIESRVWRETLGAVGLLAILAASFVFNKKMPFPGLLGLIPCGGAALIIASGRSGDTWVSRTLAQPPIVALGLISYSLYLWHFPIISFYRSWVDPVPQTLATSALAAASIVAAVLSFFVIERPLRRSRRLWPDRWVFRVAILGIGLLLTVAAAIVASGGFPSRFSPAAIVFANFVNPPDPQLASGCFLENGASNAPLPAACLESRPDRKNLLLLGDSHVAFMKTGLEAAFPGVRLLQATAGGCKPFRGYRDVPTCQSMLRFVFDEFLPNHKVDGIVLGGNWTPDDVARMPALIASLTRYSSNIVVIGPAPNYRGSLPLLLARGLVRGDPDYVDQHLMRERADTDAQFRAVLLDTPARYISAYQALCDAKSCVKLDEAGAPVQFDYGHFTVSGATLLARRMKAAGAYLVSE